MDRIILDAQSITYAYPDFGPVLNDVTFCVQAGERLALVGANGAGKSTLLMILNGLLKPDQGRLILKGQDVSWTRKGLVALRSQVGLVFQDPDDQLFAATVFEDVSFGPLNLGCSRQTVQGRTLDALQTMGIADLAGRAPHMLSFGQRKRAAIAGVLAMTPEVLLLDEPTAGLDPEGTQALMDTLSTLSQGGTAVVVATHDMDIAYAWADRVALFGENRVVRAGDPGSVFQDVDLLHRLGLREPLVHECARTLFQTGALAPGQPWPRNRADLVSVMKTLTPSTRTPSTRTPGNAKT